MIFSIHYTQRSLIKHQVHFQLYKALKMDLLAERKENEAYNLTHLACLGKGYTKPEKVRNSVRCPLELGGSSIVMSLLTTCII